MTMVTFFSSFPIHGLIVSEYDVLFLKSQSVLLFVLLMNL